MKHLFLTLTFLFLSHQEALWAHSDHVHAPSVSIKPENAKELASAAVAKLVANGKIDKSWKNIQANAPTEKKSKNNSEWVVTFDNPTIEDKEKKKLYVFVNMDGRVLASNFTGK